MEADGTGGLWITLPSGRRYHRPAEPMLDHPGLIAPAGAADRDPTDGDPDPPATDELEIPPF